jgi:alanyl-tRNA synthetase
VIALGSNYRGKVSLFVRVHPTLTGKLSAVELIRLVGPIIGGGGGGSSEKAEGGGKKPGGLKRGLELWREHILKSLKRNP